MKFYIIWLQFVQAKHFSSTKKLREFLSKKMFFWGCTKEKKYLNYFQKYIIKYTFFMLSKISMSLMSLRTSNISNKLHFMPFDFILYKRKLFSFAKGTFLTMRIFFVDRYENETYLNFSYKSYYTEDKNIFFKLSKLHLTTSLTH